MAGRGRRTGPPTIEVRSFSSVDEIDRGIAKLRKRIEDVLGLSQFRFDDPRVENIESAIRESLRDIFGDRSPEFDEHEYHRIWDGGYNYLDDDFERQNKFTAGIHRSSIVLEGLITRLEEKKVDLADRLPFSSRRAQIGGSRRVFVVHGRDEAAKEAVARFLSKLDLEPIILHEQANKGRTLIEKFEDYSDVGFAVVLLTPDDVGRHAAEPPTEERPRARQNVVFELGYFVGRLGRERVCAVLKGGIERPSDIEGILYIPMDDGAWRLLLAKEIREAGIEVDLNRAI